MNFMGKVITGINGDFLSDEVIVHKNSNNKDEFLKTIIDRALLLPKIINHDTDFHIIDLGNNIIIMCLTAKILYYENGVATVWLPYNFAWASAVATSVWHNIGNGNCNALVQTNKITVQLWDQNNNLYSGNQMTNVILIGQKQ